MVTFVGEAGVQTYRAIALKHGLLLYANTRMRPNRAWTPMRMLNAAGKITGKMYKRGAYVQAAHDLEQWVHIHGTTGHDNA